MNHRRVLRTTTILLLATTTGLLVHTTVSNFVTVDEAAHISAGVRNWQEGAFDLYAVNPPLPRMLATLPVLAMSPKSDYTALGETFMIRHEQSVGWDFAIANGSRYLSLVRLSRIAGVGWFLLGAVLVLLWSRELFGETGALLSLAVYVLDPQVTGHAGLTTPDVPAAVAALGSTYLFWKLLRRPTPWGILACGVALGIAQLTKFTNLLLYPMWAILMLLHFLSVKHGPSIRIRLFHALVIGLLSLFTLNAGYAFSETLRPLGAFSFLSPTFKGFRQQREREAPPYGNRFAKTWMRHIPVPLPAEYVRGLDLQNRDFDDPPPSYFRGTWSKRGWWYYYFYGLGVKWPIGIGLIALGALAWPLLQRIARRKSTERIARHDLAMLLIPGFGFLLIVSAQTAFNHHLRYILPVLPFFYVYVGRLMLARNRVFRGSILLLLLWSGISVAREHPHELSYFNELAGGPARGDEHLIDSNIDWGQDALALAEWTKKHPQAGPLGFAYFGGADPMVLGLEYNGPPSAPPVFVPGPGLFAVSVNLLRGMEFVAPTRDRWVVIPAGAYDYFQKFSPRARIGYSIRIFCITPAQARMARLELGLPPLDESAKATVDCDRFPRE